MRDYFRDTKPYWLTNLAEQLKSPTLVRIDINQPLKGGRVLEVTLRARVYAYVLQVMAEYAGLVVLAHQGRPGESDFVSLRSHFAQLRKLLPLDIEIEFIPHNKMYSKETIDKIRRIREKQIILLDNVRMFEEEFSFNPETSNMISKFRGVIKRCVNDAMPAWHRAHTSLMALPHIAYTYVGMRAVYELKVLSDLLGEKWENCAIVMGGRKLEKLEVLERILKRMEGFTGGIPGQLIARAKGYDLGPKNNAFLERIASIKQFKAARRLADLGVHHPVDFTVFENGEAENVPIEKMKGKDSLIVDIGEETVRIYSQLLSKKTFRIRAGPLGIYEKGFLNGIELTKRIMGSGLIFLGGDTSQEALETGIIDQIRDTGGHFLLSGGAFLHGLAGLPYPSVEEILKQNPL